MFIVLVFIICGECANESNTTLIWLHSPPIFKFSIYDRATVNIYAVDQKISTTNHQRSATYKVSRDSNNSFAANSRWAKSHGRKKKTEQKLNSQNSVFAHVVAFSQMVTEYRWSHSFDRAGVNWI